MGMKLGKDTASVVNWLQSGHVGIPVVGDGATEFMWTDRKAYTVVKVSKDGKSCTIREDSAKPLFTGMTDSQSYEYSANEEGITKELVYKWKAWRQKLPDGSFPKVDIRFGMRDKYHDFSF